MMRRCQSLRKRRNGVKMTGKQFEVQAERRSRAQSKENHPASGRLAVSITMDNREKITGNYVPEIIRTYKLEVVKSCFIE